MDKGPYLGTVILNSDPAKLGRIKISVPHVYGILNSDIGAVGLSDLPWAIPAGLPAGGTSGSGGIDWLPSAGDQVIVFFLDGEPEKPVWMWLMQTLDQQSNFPLHSYSDLVPKGVPTRAGLTRYGHTVELNSGSAFMSTHAGYQLVLIDGTLGVPGDGQVQLNTPLGQYFELDDSTQTATLNVGQDHYVNVGVTWQAMAGDIDFEALVGKVSMVAATDFSVDATNNVELASTGETSITAETTMNLDAANLNATVTENMTTDVTGSCNFTFGTLNLGTDATHPYVLGDNLLDMLNLLLVYLAGHTHSNGDNGSPTGPPIVPPQATVEDILGTILSTTIKGQ